jgi:hypothetical protein
VASGHRLPSPKWESSMRIALWVVVVAVHVLVIWLFTLSRRAGSHEQEELTLVPISMLPEVSKSQALASSRGGPTQHGGSTHVPRAPSNAQSAAELPAMAELPGPLPSNTDDAEPPTTPDWRAQAEITAQASAQEIVTAEDDARRRASALAAPFKPMPGPRERGHEFGWDLAPKHRFTAIGHGAYVFPVSDQCAIVVIIVPMIGCSLGPKPPANGDLFKYMRGPVKFGDWDWRAQDP